VALSTGKGEAWGRYRRLEQAIGLGKVTTRIERKRATLIKGGGGGKDHGIRTGKMLTWRKSPKVTFLWVTAAWE